MQNQIFTLKQVLEYKMVPVGKRQLMNLIQLGEQKKNGVLPDGMNYILAINLGSGKMRSRWGIEDSEIIAWAKRAKNSKQTT